MIRASLSGAPYRVEIDARGHLLVADETPALGGADAGPAPFDLVLSGLAACTLITLRMYADRKGWSGTTFTAELRHRMDADRHLIDRTIQVAGAPDAAALQRMAEIAERTPVTLALKAGFSIATDLTPAEGASSETHA